MKLGITMLINNKDDIQFVTEFPWFWDTLYNRRRRRTCKLSVQLYSDVTSVNSVIINNIDNFRIKCLSYSKISAEYFFIFWFHTFFIYSWEACQLMWENVGCLALFDTCYVVYNLFISLLAPIVLDNLFGVVLVLGKITNNC